MNKGSLFVIAAPSGAGKTTLVRVLTESIPDIKVSVSHTTRPRRKNEVDGEDYYFVDKAEFQRLIAQDDFLEHATVFDNWYGTSKSMVSKALAEGSDVILEIDWQGHQQIKKLFPDAIGIFILPPSLDVLRERLIRREQVHPDILKERLADVQETVSHIGEFDYVVINDEFNHAVHDLKSIVEAARLSAKRQIAKHKQLVDALQEIA